MSGNNESGSLEGTLFHLLNTSAGQRMEPGNLLLLASLVNLMGLVNLIGHRLGVDVMSAPADAQPGAAAPSGGGRGAAPAVPPNLAGLLGSLLAPPGNMRNKEAPSGTENASGGGAGEAGKK